MAVEPGQMHDMPHAGHSHGDGSDRSQAVALENTLCPGCKKSAVNETGGLVVAFGQSFFHVDCFKCAKCGDKVTADTNLLLLSDGSPICANCSYSCNICHLPILDEAIMTGDDAYHAHCFKCKVCSCRIDDLVFAKTSQGIYCMKCHNERMIKVRKHAQRKAEREKERAANGGSSTSRSRDRSRHREASNQANEFGQKSATLNGQPDPLSSISSSQSVGSRQRSLTNELPRTSPIQSNFSQNQPSVTFRSPDGVNTTLDTQMHLDPDKTPLAPRIRGPEHTASAPQPLDGRSESNNLPASSSDSLRVAPNKRAKRQSINPGLVLAPTAFNEFQRPSTSPTLSPNSVNTFGIQRSPPITNGRDSPRAPSPLRERFPTEGASSRPTSSHSQNEFGATLTPPPHDGHTRFSQLNDTPRNRTVSASATISQSETLTRPPLRPTLSTEADPQVTDDRRQKRLSPDITLNGSTIRTQRSFDERSRSAPRKRPSTAQSLSIVNENSYSRSASPRPASPAHRADVPHGIESGTDTEDSKLSSDEGYRPPPPPPKDTRPSPSLTSPLTPGGVTDSEYADADSGDDIELESNRVQRVSQTTFIAPALPPIRFSMNSADFSELLGSVGANSLKNVDYLALQKVTEESGATTPTPPTAPVTNNERPSTPKSDTTIEAHLNPGALADAPRRSLDSAAEANAKAARSITNRNHFDSPISRPVELETSSSHSSPSSLPSMSSSSTLVRSKSEARSSPTHHRVSSSNSSRSRSDSLQTHETLIENGLNVSTGKRPDTSDLVLRRLKEAINDAEERGAQQLKLDKGFIGAIIQQMDHRANQFMQLKGSLDGAKRASRQYQDGLTVAHAEYDKEFRARRDAEAEVTRLRVLLSSQAVRLTALAGEERKQQLKEQLGRDLSSTLSNLEQDLARLKVARDIANAEKDVLGGLAGPQGEGGLMARLDRLKTQYEQDLIPLKHQREALAREITELRMARDMILEETTVLSARNEELAQLNTQYARRAETLPPEGTSYKPRQSSFDQARPSPHSLHQSTASVPALNLNPLFNSSSVSITPASDESHEPKPIKATRSDSESTPSKPKFKWPGTRMKEPLPSVTEAPTKMPRILEHAFQQVSVLRFTKCDHCNEKLWGSQLRCTACHISIHNRCLQHVKSSCQPPSKGSVSDGPPPPSMFGRDLVEQVQADAEAEDSDRTVPVIVEKCIDAVDESALDYEGIYRKTGGSGQSKAITALFERGNYDAFDLRDTDRFNDICSITSVLKTYFRSLPNPLFTYDLHDSFMSAIHIRDVSTKAQQMHDLIHQLPTEHYYTLRLLMLHLNRVCERSEKNLMNARNLGVVFGPTLLRSRDPSAEFGDMAGKALSVEWLVENAPQVFGPIPSQE